jgi:hypothetical protein
LPPMSNIASSIPAARCFASFASSHYIHELRAINPFLIKIRAKVLFALGCFI